MPYAQAADRTAGALSTFVDTMLKVESFLLHWTGDAIAIVLVMVLLIGVLTSPAVPHLIMLKGFFRVGVSSEIAKRNSVLDKMLSSPDSMVISSACHAFPEEGDISEKEVQFKLVKKAKPDTPALYTFSSRPSIIGETLQPEENAGATGNIPAEML
jgi:hypothetical protein